MSMYWTKKEYIAALKKKRAEIAEGEPFEFWDDETPGMKHTECSWGLSSTVIPYRHPEKHRCPLDTRTTAELDGNGCFWSCRVHQEKHKAPTREEALALYDATIEEADFVPREESDAG